LGEEATRAEQCNELFKHRFLFSRRRATTSAPS